MSWTLALAMQERIAERAADPASALSAWAAAHDAVPQITLGYRKPTGASGWPFIALVPALDEQHLQARRGLAASVTVAVGYRLPQVERGDADGIRAVEALAEAVIEALGAPWRTPWAREMWVAARASRTDAELKHPAYELELAIEFSRLGLDSRRSQTAP